jgi:hypothetical protein
LLLGWWLKRTSGRWLRRELLEWGMASSVAETRQLGRKIT